MVRSDKNSCPGTANFRGHRGGLRSIFAFLAFAGLVFLSSCTQLKKPEPEPFFAETTPPPVQEFRWSNGKLPKSFDPALAAAPPETDVVRALYEGLTEVDPVTLQEVPGVAESWSASENNKVWTFKLRQNAKWSNGKPVTADYFVRAWTRLVKMGDKTAHRNLLKNIVGVPKPDERSPVENAPDPLSEANSNTAAPPSPLQRMAQEPANANRTPSARPSPSSESNTAPAPPNTTRKDPELGVVAVDEYTLKVTLVVPDKDFPKLVAHPIFRPIFSNGEEFVGKELNRTIVTNGPFSVASVEPGGIVLERSDLYWNRDNVKLERVRMVVMDSPESALAAYRSGDLDAVTNTDFSSLVLKLLTPYEDFRKTAHSALNFYEVNVARPPFSDRRVREALSNAIERERLTETEMDGSARPALNFQAVGTGTRPKLAQDKEKAKDLLDEAGFPDGEGFPVVKLVVNRNDTQQRVARAVAKMWKQNLNIETEVVVKEPAEVELARKSGEFDLVRRGVVMPTSDETVNFMEVFDLQDVRPASVPTPSEPPATRAPSPPPDLPLLPGRDLSPIPGLSGDLSTTPPADPPILNEDEALYQLRAIPLYFPTSYSLVKPYVTGFEMNSLDAIVLSNVVINNDWRPSARDARQ